MADDQPGEQTPAAGPSQLNGPVADPTRVEADAPERSTLDAPIRWSGSAAVPPPAPKRPWLGRRRPAATPPDRAMTDDTDWSTTPPVDPWAGQDTPWDPMPAVPQELPPTRMEEALPPTRLEPPAPPPAAAPPPVAPQPVAPQPVAPQPPAPPPAAPRSVPAQPAAPRSVPAQPAALRPVPAQPAALPPVAAPPTAPPPAPRRRWGARKKPPALTQPVNRIPIAPRPAPPPPPAWRPPPTAARPLPARPLPARPLPARPLPPPRRKRHRLRGFSLFTLFGLLCCCGVPVAYFAWPPARQYPVRADLPASVADLNLRDDGASRRAVARLTQDLTTANAKVDQVFAGVYSDGNGKRVTVFGTTGFRLTPGSDADSELDHLTGDYDLKDVETYKLDEPGTAERCGVGDSGGASVVVCVWADHGSLATVVATRRSAPDSAALTAILRSAILTRG